MMNLKMNKSKSSQNRKKLANLQNQNVTVVCKKLFNLEYKEISINFKHKNLIFSNFLQSII